MIFHIVDNQSNAVFTNAHSECIECFNVNANKNCLKLECRTTGGSCRVGVVFRNNYRLYLCTDNKQTKTSKLFKEKIEMLSYVLPSMLEFKTEIEKVVRNEEKEKYSKIVHNLKTLNGQSLLSQYKFIPQDSFSDNYRHLFEMVLEEVKKRPKEATIAILKQSRNNEFMKTEFSTHEKLTIEAPNLFCQSHVVRKVILNVYHSFDMDFKDKKVSLLISEVDYKAWFDYDTVRVAIYHIFSNAIKYIAPSSNLAISIIDDEDNIIIDFKMKSYYISKEEVNNLFVDHYSGKIATENKLNGTGLGMGLIRKALSLNKGTITVIPGERKIFLQKRR